MAIDPTPLPESAPSWFTPKRLLVFFCAINMINYIDRGAISTNGVNGSPRICTESNVCSDGSGIQGSFDLSNFKDGILASAFMVGLLIACPIFASLAKSVNPFRLIGVGLSVWTLAVVGCGFSVDFWSITICRMLVGVGEASYIGLAAPLIVENAPVSERTLWLGIFHISVPAGVAIGDVYGGLMSESYNELGVEISSELAADWVLQSLPESYSEFVREYYMMDHDVTLIDLTYLLIAAESAMIWRANQENLSGESNSQTSMDTGNIGSAERIKSVIVRCAVPKESICFYCQEKGHWRRSCPNYLRDLRDGRVKSFGSTSERKLKGRSELNLIVKKWISIALLEDWILELLLGVRIDC
ncbi:hypothetical protein Lser_V15G45948 [Lactuca serriola]